MIRVRLVGVWRLQIDLRWSEGIQEKFPKLVVCIGLITGVSLQKENERLAHLKKAVYEEVKRKFVLETLKDDPTVRAYRDFYWKLNIDPTKTRPAGEALLRRVLHGDQLPEISAVVDAYNLASMKTLIPISGFDFDALTPPFQVRFVKNGEAFTGIGMKTPMSLTQNMVVLADTKRAVCVYPYRDCDHTKITMATENVVIVGYGACGIASDQIEEAAETALEFIRQVSGGEIAAREVFRSGVG
jgi:DNA/RNA-binding domain of Phe-tRNA-synthetase-like protein